MLGCENICGLDIVGARKVRWVELAALFESDGATFDASSLIYAILLLAVFSMSHELVVVWAIC